MERKVIASGPTVNFLFEGSSIFAFLQINMFCYTQIQIFAKGDKLGRTVIAEYIKSTNQKLIPHISLKISLYLTKL